MSRPAETSSFDDRTGTTRLTLRGTLSANVEVDMTATGHLDSLAHEAIANSLEDLARLHRARADHWRILEGKRKKEAKP